jgi:hypothetical protein
MERALSSVVMPGVAGRGRGSSDVAVASALEDHRHEWRRLPDAVGLFACRDRRCLWCAVCPGCLGSLDIAILVRDGVVGMALYWCPVHQGEM